MTHRASEVATFHADMMDNYQPSMRQRIDLRKQWFRALKIAKLKLADYDQVDWERFKCFYASQILTDCCPISLNEICAEDFDFYAAVAHVDRLTDKRP